MKDLLFGDEKTGVYVSSYYLNFMLRGIPLRSDDPTTYRFDFDKFRKMLREDTRLITCNYYFNPVMEGVDPGRKLADRLSYHGWRVVGQEQIIKNNGAKTYSHNSDPIVDMALDVVNDSKHLDHIVILTSDSNISPAIDRISQNGCRVTVIGDERSPIGRINDLRRAANEFIDLASGMNQFLIKND